MRPNYSANNTGRILPVMDETKRIVAMLRKRAAEADDDADSWAHSEVDYYFHRGQKDALNAAANYIENGGHMKDETDDD